jgi:polyisoprenoid-binding protein YceI
LRLKTALLITYCLFILPTLHAQKALQLQKYSVEYKVKNAGFNTKGRFDKMTANVIFDESALEKSSILATIETNSFNSGMTMRDNHMKNKDYFDVQTYPTLKMVSTKITKNEKGYVGTFNLTIKSTTQTIQLPFTIVKKGNVLDFQSAELSIDRTAFGVGKSHFSLSNTVRLVINATFTE